MMLSDVCLTCLLRTSGLNREQRPRKTEIDTELAQVTRDSDTTFKVNTTDRARPGLVVLVELSVLAKWLARKTPLRKPKRVKGIVSRKPRPKSAHDFLGLLYCFIVLLCICVVSCHYVIYYPTVMARYSLFVLKVPLNPKQTNNFKVKGRGHRGAALLTAALTRQAGAQPGILFGDIRFN